MIRTGVAALMLALAISFAGSATAQGWTQEGIAFAGRDDWCDKETQQDNGSGGMTDAVEVRPCGLDFPYMSVGAIAYDLDALVMSDLASQAADAMEGPDGDALTEPFFLKQDSSCTKISRVITRNPIAGISGFGVEASYNCPELSDTPTLMRNYTAYAQQENGTLWVVAFDYPLADITEDDKAMLRDTVNTIAAN